MKITFFAIAMLLMAVAIPASWAQSDSLATLRSDIDVDQLPAQDLRNKPVYDTKSEKIATVSEVTGTPGQTRQAILYTGGVLGVGGKEVALPLDKFSVATDGRLVLTMTQDQLKLLPKYR